MSMWKTPLLAALGGFVLSAGVLAVTLGAILPTKGMVSAMISLESPYVKDRNLILYRLEQIDKKLNQLLERD